MVARGSIVQAQLRGESENIGFRRDGPLPVVIERVLCGGGATETE